MNNFVFDQVRLGNSVGQRNTVLATAESVMYDLIACCVGAVLRWNMGCGCRDRTAAAPGGGVGQGSAAGNVCLGRGAVDAGAGGL